MDKALTAAQGAVVAALPPECHHIRDEFVLMRDEMDSRVGANADNERIGMAMLWRHALANLPAAAPIEVAQEGGLFICVCACERCT